MYQNNLVAVVKVDGKVLREKEGTVAIPFGSEYSIFIKNLSSVRAIVNVSIDGKDVTRDGGVVVHPRSSVDLERSINNGNLEKGNRFKFIQRTSAIEEHRGIEAEDGLVRIEYKFEEKPVYKQPVIQPVEHHHHHHHNYPSYPYSYWGPYWGYWGINTLGGSTTYTSGMNTSGLGSSGISGSVENSSGGFNAFNAFDANLCKSSEPPSDNFKSRGILRTALRSAVKTTVESSESEKLRCRRFNDAGITVPGSESNQKFVTVQGFPTETTAHVLILKLVGKVQGTVVAEPVTVEAKPVCSTCGRTNKATHKFCTQCGTALQLF